MRTSIMTCWTVKELQRSVQKLAMDRALVVGIVC